MLGHAISSSVTPSQSEITKHLFIAAQAGDTQAFEGIVFHFQRKIYHFVAERVGPQYAEDLTQETFLKLYKNIHHYDASKECNAWVYTIARTTVYDWLRKERKRNDHHIIDDDNNPFEPSDEVAGQFHAIERAAVLIDAREALKQLSAEQQQALVLYYWNGYTYAEIADFLSKPLNTVKTLLFRAKQRMKILLEPTLA